MVAVGEKKKILVPAPEQPVCAQRRRMGLMVDDFCQQRSEEQGKHDQHMFARTFLLFVPVYVSMCVCVC